ncbi:MAG: alpha-ketoglutarate-dependent dioxygenase AlkB [Hyphomonadaceae bacterium]|jgi:alkylated DNA repair protein (DNA oxidative demethylase)|nr:alpha-ketoglutarate-dependent dioxygenase AlkB [Hyphomonadaceae bacterium]
MTEGFRFLPEYFPPAAQKALVAEILAILETNPLYRGAMPRTGKPLSVRNTNLGALGWVSDIKGYRYQPIHPDTGQPWGPIPRVLLDLWSDVSAYPHPPQACLVNWYEADSRLGLHIDADETAKDAPVVSLSLGSRALFRLGGLERSSPTSSMRLASGDVVILGGASRRAYHGVDRIYAQSSTLIPGGGRINLTLRRVTAP